MTPTTTVIGTDKALSQAEILKMMGAHSQGWRDAQCPVESRHHMDGVVPRFGDRGHPPLRPMDKKGRVETKCEQYYPMVGLLSGVAVQWYDATTQTVQYLRLGI